MGENPPFRAARPTGFVALLDCSRLSNALFWGCAGVILALLTHLLQAPPNLASLLRVGSTNPFFSTIQKELGPVMAAGPIGHDGQLYYLVARDPFARRSTADALASFDQNPPGYRYRRILLPLIAGGAGTFDPRTTLLALIGLTILGLGLAAVGVADLAHQFGRTGPLVLLAMLNIGALLSVMLVTADVLALGLSLVGIALAVRERFWSAVLVLTLASLTKETYWLVALGLSPWFLRRSGPGQAFVMATVPGIPLACWSLWLWFVLPQGTTKAANLSVPFAGIAAGLVAWYKGSLDPVQATFALYVVGSIVLGAVAAASRRNAVLAWLATPWLMLACISGISVWVIPTNAARAFSILWPLALLPLARNRARRNDALIPAAR